MMDQTTAIAVANNLPQLVANLKIADPVLAEQIAGKSALGSKTLWITPASAIVTYGLVRYGIALDPATEDLVAGLLAFAVSTAAAMVMRFFTRAPIVSVLPK